MSEQQAAVNGAAAGIPQTAEGVSVPDWRKWISKTRAQTRLSLNSRRFEKHVNEGDLPKGMICPDGTLRWDPSVIEAFGNVLEGADGEVVPDDSKQHADLAKASAMQVTASTSHTERMFTLMERAFKDTIAAQRLSMQDLRDENESLRERVHLVEQARTELITARESLLSEQAARDIAARESATKDARKKQMFDIFAARAPGVLDALGKTLGIAKNDQAKISAVIDLANDLDPAVLEGLAAAGLLSEKQIALVETILGKKISKPEAKPAEPEATTTTEKKADAESQ